MKIGCWCADRHMCIGLLSSALVLEMSSALRLAFPSTSAARGLQVLASLPCK